MDENYTADFDSTLNEETEQDTEEVVVQQQQKKKDSVVKLLADRNKLRNEIKELRANVEDSAETRKRLADLEELVAKQALESEKKTEKMEFFNSNPKAKMLEEDIDRIMSEKDLTYQDAFKLAAAEKNPTLLMDEQTVNKLDSNSWLTWVPRDNMKKDSSEYTTDDIKNMSDDEFLKFSEDLARKERLASWFIR